MRVALICNPGAGGGLEADGTAGVLRSHGADVVQVVDTPDAVRPEGVDRIVVVSGDGMLGAAAEAAARLGVPLAVVPGGTANDFARSRELPMDAEEAIALAATGEELEALELARMDGRPFVNVASAGLSPAAADRAEPLKGKLGPLAYPVGGLTAAVAEDPLALRAVVDGEEVFAGDAWQVTVASTGAFGGGADIDAADPGDGRLDLLVFPAGPRIALARRAAGLLSGSIAEQGPVEHRRGDEIVLEVPPGTSFNVDGEVVEASGTITFAAPGEFLLVKAGTPDQ